MRPQDLTYNHAEAILPTQEFSLSTEMYLEALFEHWLSLECLSENVKTHLKHLQIGLAPLVVADKTFFTNHYHPMRQTLRALIEQCYLYSLSRETALLVKVEYKIHQLSLRFLQSHSHSNILKTPDWENIYDEVFAFLKSLKVTDSAFNERYMTRLEKENLSWQKHKEEGSTWIRHTWQAVTCPIIWQFFLLETVPFLLAQTARTEYVKELLQTIHTRCFSGHSTSQNAQTWLPLIKAIRALLLESGYNAYVLVHFSSLLEDHLFFDIQTAKETSCFTMLQAPNHASFAQTSQTQKEEFEHILKKVVGMQSASAKR
jgi:hypothetical protein